MTADHLVGKDVLLPALGLVNVRRLLKSGAVEVESADGKRWLVPHDEIPKGERVMYAPCALADPLNYRKDGPHVGLQVD